MAINGAKPVPIRSKVPLPPRWGLWVLRPYDESPFAKTKRERGPFRGVRRER